MQNSDSTPLFIRFGNNFVKMRIEVKSWVLQVLCKRDGFFFKFLLVFLAIKVSKRKPQVTLFRHSVRRPLREEALCICLPNNGLGTVVTGAAACQNIVYLHVTKI